MKGIDIVYHADNNTMELKDAPDDLLIGTDGDDYATYLNFQIIDDEGILDGFSPYVLFEVESRPMIGLDESYTLNLTQDLLNKARYGKLPFILVFKGKESTIEIHSVNTLTLGIAHSIDADREVKDDASDSELAIKYVEITYHAESRLMELTDMPDDQFVGTDGDDYATYLRFTMDDPNGLLTGYGARVEFDVSIKDENGDTYKPFIIIDESMSVPLIQRILSNVKYGAIPIQMAFKGTDSEGRTSQYYSLNKLRLSISDSIRALEGIDVNDRIDLNSVINNVEYNPKTATFSFRQIDGGSIAVQLSDLSEEHFEVPTKDDLKELNKAQNGDTATTLDDGKWYKLYGDYSDLQSWKVMSPSVKAVDDHISDRENPHNVTKSQIGLGNVDNTSDINKPISTATQNALDTKADSQELSELSKIVSDEIADRESSEGIINESISNHISDTNNPHNVTKEQLGLGNVDNTSDVNKPISTATQNALDDKADKTTVSSLSNTLTKEIQDRQAGDNTNATAISTHATNKSNPHNVTKAQVGLGNVDNTSDANKPISTAVQNALNLKADKTEISALYRPKGSVATVNDLPMNAQIGDVYDVQSTGMNYVWTGSKWDELGAIIDLSPYYTKTEVDGALSGKVSKSGDTMTGGLTINRTLPAINLKMDNLLVTEKVDTNRYVASLGMLDRSESTKFVGGVRLRWFASGTHRIGLESMGETESVHGVYAYADPDGTGYATAPSWSVGTNDNSDKVLTIKMANSLPSLVHTTQNESISGVKRFTSIPIFPQQITLVSSQSDASVYPSTWRIQSQISIRDSTAESREIGLVRMDEDSTSKRLLLNNMAIVNGTTVNSTIMAIVKNTGVAYATAPSTPSVATSNEIATANWSLGNFVKKTGDTMTGTLTLQQGGWNNLTFKHTVYDVLNPSGGDERTLNICAYDVNTQLTTSLTTSNNTDYVRTYLASYGYKSDGTRVSSAIDIYANRDGTAYVLAPTPSNKADNSRKIATTSWISSADVICRTVGNQTIGGDKTYSGKIISTRGGECALFKFGNIKQGSTNENRVNNYIGAQAFYKTDDDGNDVYTPIWQFETIQETTGLRTIRLSTNFHGATSTSSWTRPLIISEQSDGSIKVESIKTPDASTGNEIATANWVIAKNTALQTNIDTKVSKSGDTMTGELRIYGTSAFTTLINTKANEFSKFIHLDNTNGTTEWVGVTQAKKWGTNGSQVELIALDRTTNVWKGIYIQNDNGSCIICGETPSSASDNSRKIPTTAWISTADCIVHKTGNESIAGVKTFTGITYLNASYGNLRLNMHNLSQTSTPPSSKQVNYMAVKTTGADGNESTVWQLETAQETSGLKYIQLATNFVNSDDASTRNWRYPFRAMQREDGNLTVRTISPPTDANSDEIATAGWTIGKFVQKTGDTMTGNLTVGGVLYLPSGLMIPASEDGIRIRLAFRGVGGSTGDRVMFLIDNNQYYSALQINSSLTAPLVSLGSANVPAYAPTPSDKADNSSKIATTGWVNQSDFLVHSYGNETISGVKTLTGNLYLHNSLRVMPTASNTRRAVVFNKSTDGSELGWLGYQSDTGNMLINLISGDYVSINKSTPTNANSNEIATANWVNTKLAGTPNGTILNSFTELMSLATSGSIKVGDVITFNLMDFDGGIQLHEGNLTVYLVDTEDGSIYLRGMSYCSIPDGENGERNWYPSISHIWEGSNLCSINYLKDNRLLGMEYMRYDVSVIDLRHISY